jgi:hypothetical protein
MGGVEVSQKYTLTSEHPYGWQLLAHLNVNNPVDRSLQGLYTNGCN